MTWPRARSAAVTMLVGCSRTVEGTAAKSGSGDVPRNDNSEKQYPNLLKECEVLTEDILAKTVGADPLADPLDLDVPVVDADGDRLRDVRPAVGLAHVRGGERRGAGGGGAGRRAPPPDQPPAPVQAAL